jgi:hypothetical protein
MDPRRCGLDPMDPRLFEENNPIDPLRFVRSSPTCSVPPPRILARRPRRTGLGVSSGVLFPNKEPRLRVPPPLFPKRLPLLLVLCSWWWCSSPPLFPNRLPRRLVPPLFPNRLPLRVGLISLSDMFQINILSKQ